jgi:hypothetical protein
LLSDDGLFGNQLLTKENGRSWLLQPKISRRDCS